jgi:NADPH-dependent 2,4-dienoyl-CoA reductase/sulfur reductase-like enzyme
VIEDCDFLLIGGGVGAYNAAKRLRRKAPDAHIVMLSRDSMAPYHLPPLSKEVIRGELRLEELPYPSLESMGLRGIDLHLDAEVVELDPTAKVMQTRAGTSYRFDKALLATGSSPVELALPGAHLDQVFYLRSAADAAGIARQARSARSAVVVGAGFIGVELAASLQSVGVAVTLIEATDRIWPRLADAGLAAFVAARCEAEGIVLRMEQRVTAILGEDRVVGVQTASGDVIDCDFVCIGVGARPNTELALRAGIACGNGIIVDEHMRTSSPDIFAIGDVACYPDPYLGESHRAEHWGHAEYSGQIAAMNMLGQPTPYDFLNYVWSDVFDLHIEAAGHHQGYDRIIVRGAPESHRFTHLYLRENRLIAYTSINGDQGEFPAYRRLIKARKSIANPEQLADMNILARSLLA